jgi:glycerol-3-phosphate dehydrogenase (NAD(P)+)
MKISVIGSGSYGTAIASICASNTNNHVTVFTRSLTQADDIVRRKQNRRYLDNLVLSSNLQASLDSAAAVRSDFAFLALPSSAIKEFIDNNSEMLSSCRVIVNLAKGFISSENITIPAYIQKKLTRTIGIASLKGPTFAADMLLAPISAVSIAATDTVSLVQMRSLLDGVDIIYDVVDDITVIEYLSILKNIYAIAIGIVEARFNNPNLRAALVTQSAVEMQRVVSLCVGTKVDILKYAGIGDLLLTGLNDQSRNRTLGLMIGKGFISPNEYDKAIVVEGLRAISFVSTNIAPEELENCLILSNLKSLINLEISTSDFIANTLHRSDSTVKKRQ